MAEIRIEIKLDEHGKITAETFGIKGEKCLDELQKLLEGLGDLQTIKKTDEFEQRQEQINSLTQKNKKL